MKKGLKATLIIVISVLIAGIAIGGFFIIRNNSLYISKQEALAVAIKDAGVDTSSIVETDTDFEKSSFSAWYEIEIDTPTGEYKYILDAATGEILSRVSN